VVNTNAPEKKFPLPASSVPKLVSVLRPPGSGLRTRDSVTPIAPIDK